MEQEGFGGIVHSGAEEKKEVLEPAGNTGIGLGANLTPSPLNSHFKKGKAGYIRLFKPHVEINPLPLGLLSRTSKLDLSRFNAVFDSKSHSTPVRQNSGWLFDCGTTDTMSYDIQDFQQLEHPTKNLFELLMAGIPLYPERTVSTCLPP